MKRRKISRRSSQRQFIKSGQMMNSLNRVRIQRGGVRF